MNHELNQLGRFELKLYCCLGIRRFRDFVFWLEKTKHIKDNAQNSNYHIKQWSHSGAKRHFMYLSYNAAIHLFGLFLALTILLIRRALGYRLCAADCGIVVAAILNIYCIMLQRYNSLRLKQYQLKLNKRSKKRIEKNARILRQKIPFDQEADILREDVLWIGCLGKAVKNHEVFVIEKEQEADSLNRLAGWVESAGINNGFIKAVSPSLKPAQNPAFNEMKGAALYSKAERNARRLRKMLRKTHEPNDAFCFVITAGSRCRKAFERLFIAANEDTITEVVDTLIAAIPQKRDGPAE